MSSHRRQIFAYSGILQLESDRFSNFDLASYPLTLTSRRTAPRLCYIPTAIGDDAVAVQAKQATFKAMRPDVEFTSLTLFPQPSVPDIRSHLLAQDVILVEGGSVANLMAVWRVHGLPAILRECWEAGVVLSGPSAGSLCWHIGGPTDSYSNRLDPFVDGLALLPYSNGVHDDFPDQPRRRIYRAQVANETLPAGYATEDGVGLHYIGDQLHEAVSIRSGARAWFVERTPEGTITETAIPARRL